MKILSVWIQFSPQIVRLEVVMQQQVEVLARADHNMNAMTALQEESQQGYMED